MSNVKLTSLSFLERQEYEELKNHYSVEAKRLRQQKVFLGVAVVAFIAVLATFQVFGVSV